MIPESIRLSKNQAEEEVRLFEQYCLFRLQGRRSVRKAVIVNMTTWLILLTMLVGSNYLRQSAAK